VQQRVALLKRQGRVLGFRDLLQRLVQALQAPHGARLRARITAQYPVALIDEFQDTSPCSTACSTSSTARAPQPDTALLLIGDPKQSIYGFRGADIYSYLEGAAPPRAPLPAGHQLPLHAGAGVCGQPPVRPCRGTRG
jgi:exodeoxyribonuclease V beta subunit